MTSGYKIVWTKHALNELSETLRYLEQNFSASEIHRLSAQIESVLSLIVAQPEIYPKTHNRKAVRRAVALRLNTLYYRVNGQQIEILSFFSNRQDPEKLKF